MLQALSLQDKGKRPVVTWVLLAANVVIWIAMELAGGSESVEVLQDFGALFGPLIASGEYWRLFTAMFLHVGLMHLLVNGVMLLVFGRMVEAIYGHASFAIIYVIAGLIGSVASYLMSPITTGAGASGAIFGVLGAFGAFFLARRDVLGEMGRQTFLGLGVLAVIQLLYGFATPGIDNWAHMGGLAAGFAVGMAIVPQSRIVVVPFRTFRRFDNTHTLLRRWWVIPIAAAVLYVGTWWGNSTRRRWWVIPVAAAVLYVGIWWGNSTLSDPALSLTHVYKAERLLERQSYDMALTEIGLAMRLHSESGQAYFLRGKLYAELGDTDQASGDLFKAVFLANQSGDRETFDKAREALRSLETFQ